MGEREIHEYFKYHYYYIELYRVVFFRPPVIRVDFIG